MARIGLLSDSHGRAPTTRRGVETLLREGAETLIHLGDIGTVEVIDALAADRPDTGEQVEAHVVFGNTDWDIRELAEYAEDLDVVVDHPAGRLSLERGELAFCHGHEAEPMERALADSVRYLCHGHTHRTLDSRKGATRVINPGALFRARAYTVALLDTGADELAFFDVSGAAQALT